MIETLLTQEILASDGSAPPFSHTTASGHVVENGNYVYQVGPQELSITIKNDERAAQKAAKLGRILSVKPIIRGNQVSFIVKDENGKTHIISTDNEFFESIHPKSGMQAGLEKRTKMLADFDKVKVEVNEDGDVVFSGEKGK